MAFQQSTRSMANTSLTWYPSLCELCKSPAPRMEKKKPKEVIQRCEFLYNCIQKKPVSMGNVDFLIRCQIAKSGRHFVTWATHPADSAARPEDSASEPVGSGEKQAVESVGELSK